MYPDIFEMHQALHRQCNYASWLVDRLPLEHSATPSAFELIKEYFWLLSSFQPQNRSNRPHRFRRAQA